MNDHLHPVFRSILNAAASQPSSGNWWCPGCASEVPPECVTYEEMHDPRYGGCGSKVRPERTAHVSGVSPSHGGEQ